MNATLKGLRSSFVIAALLVSSLAFAQGETATPAAAAPAPAKSGGLLQDFDTLGGNDVLLDKARELNPESTISVVQDRIVNRRSRFEVAPQFSSVLGGDAYSSTRSVGAAAYYHITPRWAIGANYLYHTNSLRAEGQHLINEALASGAAVIPEIDYPKQEYMALLNWFPIYGKMNLHDLGVAHFDIYAVGGAGQVELKSGAKTTFTAGGGIGFWFSQHLSTRAELRWQTYGAQRYDGPVTMNLTVANIQVGYLL